APEAMEVLRRYPWPGNVRELQSVLKQALLQAAGPVLLAEFLPELHPVEPHGDAALPDTTLEVFIDEQLKAGTDGLYAEVLRRVDRLVLTRVLRHTNGNQLQAAKLLGITRGSLRTKLRELGIRIDRSITGGGYCLRLDG